MPLSAKNVIKQLDKNVSCSNNLMTSSVKMFIRGTSKSGCCCTQSHFSGVSLPLAFVHASRTRARATRMHVKPRTTILRRPVLPLSSRCSPIWRWIVFVTVLTSVEPRFLPELPRQTKNQPYLQAIRAINRRVLTQPCFSKTTVGFS